MLMRRSFTLVSFCCLLLATASYGQRSHLEGYLFDAENNLPLSFANVWLKGKQLGAVSDEQGYFRLPIATEDTLVASYIGYETEQIAIALDDLSMLRIYLKPVTRSLDEIEITAGRSLIDASFDDLSASSYELNRNTILTLPSLTGEADFLKTMLLLPGAVKGIEGSSDIFVRGGDADQNLVLFNGATVYNTGHLFGFLSVFNPYATSDATLLTGGFPAHYGGRLSSIIDIKSREPDFQDFVLEGSIGTLASNLAVGVPLIRDKLSVHLAGRRTYADQVVRLFGESLPYYFYDLNAQLDYQINGSLSLQYHFYKGDDDLDYRRNFNNDQTTGTDFLIENNTHTLLLNSAFNNRLISTTKVHFTQFKYNIFSFYQDNRLRVNSDINDFGLQQDVVYTPNENHSFTNGLSVIRHQVIPNFIDSGGEIAELIPSSNGRIRNMVESAIYSSWRFTKARLTTEVGLRLSAAYQKEYLYINPEPRLNVRWKQGASGAFKASYTRMVQYMNRVSSSSFALPTDIWYPVTEQIKPQLSDQVTVGYQHKFVGPGLLAGMDIYYKNMTNQIAFKEGTNLTLNNDFEEALLQGDGNSYGLELLFRREAGKVSGWLAYTLSWSNRQFDALNNGKPFRARYDRRHNFSLVTNYKPNKRITFSAVWEFISGATFTPVIGYYAVPNAALTGVDLIPQYPDRNSVALNDSHRLDISITLHGRKKADRSWYGEWQLSLYNAYNRATPIAITLNYDEVQGTYFYEQPGLFGALPSLTYRFTYKR
jgi:hypothetical protein